MVTDWNFKEKYNPLGKTLTRKEVPAVLKKVYFSAGSNLSGGSSNSSNNCSSEFQTSPVLSPNYFETLKLISEKGVIGLIKNTKLLEAKENGTETKL